MQSTLNEAEPTHDEMWNQIAPLLDGAMEKLGRKDHDALVLRFFENKTFAEVGTTLGASEDAAKMRVNRALEKLRKFFTKRGVALSSAAITGAISANSVQAAPVALAKTVTIIAVAKGVAAGGSTLILVKGALKAIAWAKAKTVCFVGSAVLLAAGTTLVLTTRESGHEYRGTLKLVFPMSPGGPKTNLYVVVLLSEPPYWELSLTSSNENHKYLGSPEKTYEINLYDNPPAGPLNTCEIKIMPGSRPLRDRRAEHVWLALLSGRTYFGQTLPLPGDIPRG